MNYRNLGSTGLSVSTVGIGCNNFGMRCDAAQTRRVVDAAIDAGINFFDTADIYGGGGKSEELLGQALADKDRHAVIIATKFSGPMGKGALMRGASRRYIIRAVEDSLRRLNTDYIDLYQQHGPDPATPLEETLRALDDLVRAGKVRYIGSSNYAGWQIADAQWIARENHLNGFVSAQNHYSLLERGVEKEVLPSCEHFGIGLLPYFPLASGMLTGKYQRGKQPAEGTRMAAWGKRGEAALSAANFDIVDRLTEFAADNGHSILELAMSWLASKPVVSSVIAGATSPEQVNANVEAAGWQLTAEQMREVNVLSDR